MLSRALRLATVTLLFGCLTAAAVRAVENLEAGKTPSQIFAGTCNACHKSPRGLLKTVAAGSLPGFLRQHYTTSSDMASVLASFLVSNGATDTRYQSKGNDAAKEAAKQEARPGSAQPEPSDRAGRKGRPGADTQQAARPDSDGLQPEPGRKGRNAKREGDVPAQAAIDPSPEGRKAGKKAGRKGIEEPAKPSDAVKDEPSKSDSSKSDTAKGDPAKSSGDEKRDTAKSDTAKPDADKPDSSKEGGGGQPAALRPGPVPAVTPAPAPAPTTSTAASSTAPEPEPSFAPLPSSRPPPPDPAPTASASAPSVAPAGPPLPPISQ